MVVHDRSRMTIDFSQCRDGARPAFTDQGCVCDQDLHRARACITPET